MATIKRKIGKDDPYNPFNFPPQKEVEETPTKLEKQLLVGIAYLAIYQSTIEFIESTGEARAELFVPEKVKDYDLVIFTGGQDINPVYYRQDNLFSNFPSLERDASEQNTFNLCNKNNIPMFGICRGLQFLNVMLGGTLHQDIFHQAGVYHTGRHTVETNNSNNIFTSVLKKTDYYVNSMHHQGIHYLADYLRIDAHHKGIPEIIHSDMRYIYAVQFHPEFMERDVQKLYASKVIGWANKIKLAKEASKISLAEKLSEFEKVIVKKKVIGE